MEAVTRQRLESVELPNDMHISRIGLGCMPFAGMTSLNTTTKDSIECITEALDCGITLYDTAFAYGPYGESERLLGRGLGRRRSEVLVATKVGIATETTGSLTTDGSPANLRRQCEESLRRLGVEFVDILYLHAPDPKIPLPESAGAMRLLMQSGKARAIGLSNASFQQLKAFAAECPLSIYQGAHNMTQRTMDHEILPWCRSNGVAVAAYWVLMRGILTGALGREYLFAVNDKRGRWTICQSKAWQRLQDLLDVLRVIARESGKTVAQVAVRWTLDQPGISTVLCGASRASQVRENAEAMNFAIPAVENQRIAKALADYAMGESRSADGD